jgi:hypothetical protein
MNHYLVCGNPSCRFVLDLRLDGQKLNGLQQKFTNCPECGGKWSSSGPVSARALGEAWAGKLPHCSCCTRKAHVAA